jgi:hypothetical protein
MDDILWLELLQPFMAVKVLHLNNRAVLHLAHTLQGFTEETAADILPALQRIHQQKFKNAVIDK